MITQTSFENFINPGDFISVRVEDGIIYNGEYIGSDILLEKYLFIGPLTHSLKQIKDENKALVLEEEHLLKFKTMLPINTIKSIALLWQQKKEI